MPSVAPCVSLCLSRSGVHSVSLQFSCSIVIFKQSVSAVREPVRPEIVMFEAFVT